MKVAFLGPSGTYSHQAAVQAFGEHTPICVSSLHDVVDAVASGRADGAVLPVENSTNGPVNLALDALIDADHAKFRIVGETKVRIRHQLYSLTTDMSKIRTVYSHSQVWGQATKWLAANLPHATQVSCESTAKAAQLALQQPGTAAIAGPLGSSANPVCQDCGDDPTNTTRFLILQPNKNTQSHESLTNLSGNRVFAVSKRSQISAIASSAVALKFLYARPTEGAWMYDYFLEFTGFADAQWSWLGTVLDPVHARL